MTEGTTLYCQSCGMPLAKAEDFGTNTDGSKNEDYCTYCYQNGAFSGNQTMEEMIELCLDYSKDSGLYTDREQAKKEMLAWFPTLKRWKQA
ncbi:zinc ribbon domain-containing protein [Acetanaerobacterium elongatum]|uniref:Putative zinc ribbon domain-containing protein n=1 Tax=Acetanaerobacterium elongatum TaxID=258515 RepID=A0A1G9UII4_9FIRM|nr:zinc ribbon domain-containing protein [Acetanaerobacterium elongatum]SDM59732.1 Putative zinc ribbon domain-containing protein [Acetanaerobacterium elongatum]